MHQDQQYFECSVSQQSGRVRFFSMGPAPVVNAVRAIHFSKNRNNNVVTFWYYQQSSTSNNQLFLSTINESTGSTGNPKEETKVLTHMLKVRLVMCQK